MDKFETIFILLVVFFLSFSVFGHESKYLQSLELTSVLEDNVVVYIKLNENRDLSVVRIKSDGSVFSVPKTEFVNIPYPDLSTLTVERGGGPDLGPTITVKLSFGTPNCRSQLTPKLKCHMDVIFIFTESGYYQRWVTDRVAGTKESYVIDMYKKIPGEEETPRGRNNNIKLENNEH